MYVAPHVLRRGQAHFHSSVLLALRARSTATLQGSNENRVDATLAGSSATHANQKTETKLPLDFTNHRAVFSGRPTTDLLRSWLVFRLCGVPWFVNHAAQLLQVSQTVLGSKATNYLVKHTFYGQFCAGETDSEVLAKTKELSKHGVGSILDYAAEDDVQPQNQSKEDQARNEKSEAVKAKRRSRNKNGDKARPEAAIQQQDGSIGTSTSTPAPSPVAQADSTAGSENSSEPVVAMHLSPASGLPVIASGGAVARQYAYSNEQQCDAHVQIFLSSIASASIMPGQGFAAVKLTALGNPRLLERVSSAIREVRAVFMQWDKDGSGTIDREEFREGYQMLLPDASEEERQRVFKWMDTQKEDRIDYVSWCQKLSLSKMPEYAARIQLAGSDGNPAGDAWRDALKDAALTEEEVDLLAAMRARLYRLADAAAQANVKLMVDAEHTYFQPAIDHLTLGLMRKYNCNKSAVIYNTYQAYLQDAYPRLVVDLERARREGYILGAKLVRGAYLELERSRAESMGYPSPVWPSLQDTHASYARCMQELLQKVRDGRAEVLLGTHNQVSIEQAVATMADYKLDPEHSHVYFGQLLGMSDHLTYVLGQAGYHAFKYVPYGKVEQVIPYLLRRAAENSSIMKGTKTDVNMLKAELWRRIQSATGLKTAHA